MHSLSLHPLAIYLLSVLLSIVWFFVLIPNDQPDFYYHLNEVRNTNELTRIILWFETNFYDSCRNLGQPLIETLFSGSISACDVFLFSSKIVKFITVTLIIIFLASRFKNFNSSLYLLCFCMPGFIHVVSYYSLESLFFALAVVLVRLKNLILDAVLCCIGIFFLDAGSSLIYLLFITYRFFWSNILIRSRILLVFFFTTMSLILLFVGLDVLLYFEYIPIYGAKLMSVWDAYSNVYSYVYSNHPPTLRPILTFTGLIVFTPQAFGSVLMGLLIYISFSILVFIWFGKVLLFRRFANAQYDSIFGNTFVPAFIFIVSIVILLPGYSNAKYYMFLLPLVVEGLCDYFKINSILKVALIAHAIALLIVIFEIGFSRNVF